MRGTRESSIGIVNNKRLYETTPEIQAFTGIDDAAEYFKYTNKCGDTATPIDKEGFRGIGLELLKELCEGIRWGQQAFSIGADMPMTIKCADFRGTTLGDYCDTTSEIRFRRGLKPEYAFSTAVHEMAHHADHIMGHPSGDILKAAVRKLRSDYSLKQINNMKAAIAGKYWTDPSEILAYSMDKYCLGKGNPLAAEVAEAFLRRCRQK